MPFGSTQILSSLHYIQKNGDLEKSKIDKDFEILEKSEDSFKSSLSDLDQELRRVERKRSEIRKPVGQFMSFADIHVKSNKNNMKYISSRRSFGDLDTSKRELRVRILDLMQDRERF